MLTTIARWFFSTPALIIAVSMRLEPRGGLLNPPISYQKVVARWTRLVSQFFGQRILDFRFWMCGFSPQHDNSGDFTLIESIGQEY
ncbi:MAG: hypothetical protein C6Y22_14880 [Hapalosiphonaceae cyanobacterium JJU2]|nr:MAG: hypothetical protein C6Y22_14880 [Hapalosiphonaceae cyanobacterium JJU2]